MACFILSYDAANSTQEQIIAIDPNTGLGSRGVHKILPEL